MVTVQELELLCGYEFDTSDTGRAEAVIKMVSTAAEGILGAPLDFVVNEAAVNSVITSAALRMMQNKSGLSTETIGGYTAQYPSGGKMFLPEEMMMLKNSRSNTVGTVKIRNAYLFEDRYES